MSTVKVTSDLIKMLSRGDLAAVYSCPVGDHRESRARLSWEVNGGRDKMEHAKSHLE